MAPLSDEKAAELVREQILVQFSDQLAAERVRVDFEPIEGIPSDVAVPVLEQATTRFFTLSLDPAMSLQHIRQRLRHDNMEFVLIDKGPGRREMREKQDAVRVKLKGSDVQIEEQKERIREIFADPDPFRSVETIGEIVAGEMRNKAVLAILLSWIAIIFYIWFRFGEMKFGLAAVTALIHDVLLTLGAVGVADALSGTAVGQALGFSDIKINVTMIAAFLTLIGYSINDTIVVFDRIRENMGGARRRVDPEMVDNSVNQILSRTVLTSVTTFLVLVVLYVMGGPVLHGFAFVMTFGVLVGTYSSIFIASPILIGWERWIENLRRTARAVWSRK
jgi:preprotein translocase SecF subunit